MTAARIRRNLPVLPDIDAAAAAFGVGLALLVGGVVRVLPSLGAGFPLNDGGLFASMIEDLVDNRLLLPASTSYNGLNIPFAYPPLAIYVAGLLEAAFGIGTTDLLRVLPFAFSVTMIPVIYWVAEGMLGSRLGGVLTALAFALLPRSYLWMITGGGITRGLGFALALAAIGIAWRLIRSKEHRWWTTVMLGLVGGLTALAHPQAAVFMAVSILVLLPWAHTPRQAVYRIAVAGAIGLVVTMPWLAAVVGLHGMAPFISAANTGGDPLEGMAFLLSLRFTELAVFDVIGIAAIVGAVVSVWRREFLLPVWVVALWLLDSRAGSTYSMVPVSMLAAYGLLFVRSLIAARGGEDRLSGRERRIALAGGVIVIVLLVFANYVSSLRVNSPLFALSEDQRSAMAWAGSSTGESAVFAVLTFDGPWELDAVSEWFPTLTGRSSAATVQGHEWLGTESWQKQQRAWEDLQLCAVDALTCVVAWSETQEAAITHVFIPKGALHGPLSPSDCCPGPRHSVELVPGAAVIYDGPGATIIELP